MDVPEDSGRARDELVRGARLGQESHAGRAHGHVSRRQSQRAARVPRACGQVRLPRARRYDERASDRALCFALAKPFPLDLRGSNCLGRIPKGSFEARSSDHSTPPYPRRRVLMQTSTSGWLSSTRFAQAARGSASSRSTNFRNGSPRDRATIAPRRCPTPRAPARSSGLRRWCHPRTARERPRRGAGTTHRRRGSHR